MPLLTSLKRIWRALPSSNLVGLCRGQPRSLWNRCQLEQL